MSTTDLIGDPLPEPLPTKSRFFDESELIGHEVRAVYMSTSGIYGFAGMVVVTATGCWIAFNAEPEFGTSEANITLLRDYGSDKVELVGYVPADRLYFDNCITAEEFKRFKAMEQEHAVTERDRKANRLRAELADLFQTAQTEGGGE